MLLYFTLDNVHNNFSNKKYNNAYIDRTSVRTSALIKLIFVINDEFDAIFKLRYSKFFFFILVVFTIDSN